MLARYLVITLNRRIEKIGSAGWIQSILATIGLLLLGGLFWITGRVNGTDVSLASFLIITFISLGGWIGLRFISTHQPNGYYFLSKDIWLWSETAKGKLVVLVAAASTVLPYYFARLSGYTVISTVLFGVLLLATAVTLATLGELIAVSIRRLSNSALLRSILIILTIYLTLALITSYLPSIKSVEATLFINPVTSTLLPTFLFVIGLAMILVILLELVFSSVTLSSTPATQFWGANRLVRMFRLSNRPVVEAMLSSGVFLLRSSSFQRRLLVILLALLIYPLLDVLFGVQTAQDNATLAVLVGFVLAIFYSLPFGRFASDQEVAFAAMPGIKKIHPLAELIASTFVITLIMILLSNLLTPFPGAATATVIVLATASAHVILFYTSYLAEQLKRYSNSAKTENVIITGLAVSLLLTLGTINFIGLVSVLTDDTLIVLWAAVVVWIFSRSSYYLRRKQA